MKPVSFAIGDVVKFSNTCQNIPLLNGEELVVTYVSPFSGELLYTVNNYSWFKHSDLVLLSNATSESLRTALSFADENEEEEKEEELPLLSSEQRAQEWQKSIQEDRKKSPWVAMTSILPRD